MDAEEKLIVAATVNLLAASWAAQRVGIAGWVGAVLSGASMALAATPGGAPRVLRAPVAILNLPGNLVANAITTPAIHAGGSGPPESQNASPGPT